LTFNKFTAENPPLVKTVDAEVKNGN
jgi:hypothetical protein